MQLKRYTTQELIEKFTDIFYDYMSSEVNDFGTTPVSTVHLKNEERLKEYRHRIGIYESELASNPQLDSTTVKSLKEQLNYLEEGYKHIKSANMQYQKDLYKSTQSTDYCRTQIRIPLDKLINSYYDDLILEVVFYDDVCTLNGKFDEYQKLKSKEERLNFLKENTEITHMGMLYARNEQVRMLIGVMGQLNFDDIRVKESGVLLLPNKFSDFGNLRLSDTSEIDNNDLKQYIQTKIDLDKENLEQLARVFIRGDYYSIHRSPDTPDELFIRYTCRSTGRVYYNRLNLRNLSLSEYYNENDYDSYCKAWWNLNTLGGNIEGKPVIRC